MKDLNGLQAMSRYLLKHTVLFLLQAPCSTEMKDRIHVLDLECYQRMIFLVEMVLAKDTFSLPSLPLPISGSSSFNSSILSLCLWFVEIYVRLDSKIIFGRSHYEGGKKYCRRCEVYFFHNGSFCPCCGMTLRMSPTSKRDKERLRTVFIESG